MTNKVWSRDGEMYQCESLRELIDNNDDICIGDVVYVGTPYTPTANRYIDVDILVEGICANAIDDVGEWAEEWPDLSDKERELLGSIIEDFMDKHSPINFYNVGNVVEYVVTSEDLS